MKKEINLEELLDVFFGHQTVERISVETVLY